jgi:hypothetical protein
MVDSAAVGTSNSVPHWKQLMRRSSMVGFGALGTFEAVLGFFSSSRRKWERHPLQIVE